MLVCTDTHAPRGVVVLVEADAGVVGAALRPPGRHRRRHEHPRDRRACKQEGATL